MFMTWILFAIFDPILHGVANVFDNYLTNRLWKNTGSLVFYAIATNIIFIPFVFLIQRPDAPSVSAIPWILLAGILDVVYLFPYYRALQRDDTSTVSSLFSLGYIFVPILAFLFVHEILGLHQYLGFGFVVASSVAVTWRGRLRINRSLLYMMVAAFCVALEAVLYKYLLAQMSWSTAFVWSNVGSFIVIVPLLFWPGTSRAIKNSWGAFKISGHIFIIEEFFTFAGAGAMTYAISLAPVTLVEGIGALQPFFVLLYAMIFRRAFPKIFKEQTDRKSILKKFAFFGMMVIGVILILR